VNTYPLLEVELLERQKRVRVGRHGVRRRTRASARLETQSGRYLSRERFCHPNERGTQDKSHDDVQPTVNCRPTESGTNLESQTVCSGSEKRSRRVRRRVSSVAWGLTGSLAIAGSTAARASAASPLVDRPPVSRVSRTATDTRSARVDRSWNVPRVRQPRLLFGSPLSIRSDPVGTARTR
jgi:hypothetical protein